MQPGAEVALLRRLFAAAIARALPENVLPSVLPAPRAGRTVVVGAGKAAAAMARVVEEHFRGTVTGLVVTRYGHRVPTRAVEVVEAAHPVPDAAGMVAASRLLDLVRGLRAEDLVLCLMSGGASSLLALPAPGLTLDDKQAVSRALLRSGASIAEMNAVRKHLSAVKGGRLAAACRPAHVLTLAISDVPGDDPSVIGSGPTVPDPTTFADALRVLEKYDISGPLRVIDHLRAAREETPKPSDPGFECDEVHVIASARQSLEAAAAEARAAGVAAHVVSDRVEGSARDAAAEHAAIVGRMLRERASAVTPPCVLLSGGETTVTVTGLGRGGRNTEFLLALATELERAKLGGRVHALAADTDGRDGTEDNAGALLTPTTLARAASLGLLPQRHLSDNDAYSFFAALGDLVVTGPTLTNVNDFRALLVT